MTELLIPVCDSCFWRITDTSCAAFDEIPDEILVWSKAHNTPVKGQGNDVVWEFAPGTENELNLWKGEV